MTNKDKKKCNCGSKQLVFCRNCSRVSMCILLKNGNDHLKYKNNRGHLSNPVWYSPLNLNLKSESEIADTMFERFRKDGLYQKTNIVKFYVNGTTQEIKTFRL